MKPVVRELKCPYCPLGCAGKKGLTDHVLISHPREALRVALKQRDEEWEELLLSNHRRLVAWNVVAPKGSEKLIKKAYDQISEMFPDIDGVELSKAIAELVPGARVGPVAGEVLG